jgi:Protein of unknown function (DUF3224)
MTDALIRKKARADAPASTFWKHLIGNGGAQPQSGAMRLKTQEAPTRRPRSATATIASLGLLLGAGLLAYAETHPRISSANQKEPVMTKHASGTFEVKIAPQKPDSQVAESANLGRMTIDKQLHGDLEGTSKGEMLSAMSKVEGSGAYVALERVTATLHGRSGTFLFQHGGTMTRGVPHLSVSVVPDSGTDQLEGITGNMAIKIEAGKHFYEFDYALPDAH